MSGVDRTIDPTTSDYVAAVRGGFLTGDPVDTKVVMAYGTALGSWEGDPFFGHRFEELARAIDTVETRGQVRSFAIEAVQFLVDSGELVSADAIVESFGPGQVAFMAVLVKPGQKSAKKVGPFLVAVGG
jgi:phage gp46-like protein